MRGKLPLLSLHSGNMFEASLLLFDRVRDKQALGIEGEIVVAVPSRETLLVTDSSSAAGMARIAKAATETKSPYTLTDKLFVRRDGMFVPL